MAYGNRPKHAAGHDGNHFIVRDYLAYICGGMTTTRLGSDTVYRAYKRGYTVGAYDTCRLGGPWMDWVIFAGPYLAFVEVKTPESYRKEGHDLTPGEQWVFAELPFTKFIVSTDEQVEQAFETLLEWCEKGRGPCSI